MNSEADTSPEDNIVNKIVLGVLETLTGEAATSYISHVVKEETVKVINSGNFDIEDDDVRANAKKQDFTLSVHRHYARNVLDLKTDGRAIVCNGRVIGPLDDGEEFTSEDFALLERFSQSTYGEKLLNNLIKLQAIEDDDDYGTNNCVILYIHSPKICVLI